jgi:hypothetical protein
MALKHACFLSAEEANLGRLEVSTFIRRISIQLALSLAETDLRVVLSEFEMHHHDACAGYI